MQLRTDPQEADPEFRRKLLDAIREAQSRVEAQGVRGAGSCYAIWDETQRILEEKYGLHWHTPAEMNPNVIFD